MIKIIILTIVLTTSSVLARPQHAEPIPVDGEVVIVSRTEETDGKGTFQWSYKLSDGTEVEQSGYTIPPPDASSDPIVVVRGSYKYPAPDGTIISRSYIADQYGFQPMGDDIPAYYNPRTGARSDVDSGPTGRSPDKPTSSSASKPVASQKPAKPQTPAPAPQPVESKVVTESSETAAPIPEDVPQTLGTTSAPETGATTVVPETTETPAEEPIPRDELGTTIPPTDSPTSENAINDVGQTAGVEAVSDVTSVVVNDVTPVTLDDLTTLAPETTTTASK